MSLLFHLVAAILNLARSDWSEVLLVTSGNKYFSHETPTPNICSADIRLQNCRYFVEKKTFLFFYHGRHHYTIRKLIINIFITFDVLMIIINMPIIIINVIIMNII
jgi:hypothetical protein